MANNITGINDDVISQAALEQFIATLTPLNAFSTSYSADAARKGSTISIPIVPASDAATTKSTHTDYTIQDADMSAVEITLGEPVYVSWGLDDVEVASSSVLNMEQFGRQKGHTLAKKVLQDIWALVTNANYSTAAVTSTAANFDFADLETLATACDEADMPDFPRSLILKPAHYNALIEDVKEAQVLGSDSAIAMGKVTELFGFRMYKSNLIPANSENLCGFAAHPSALAVAIRYLEPQAGAMYNRAERLTDPATGITIGIRDWYDHDSGVRKRVLECVYGYKVTGITGSLKRIVTS